MDALQLIAERKVTRYFRARRKLVHAGLVSHITQRAAGKDRLFIEESDYLAMLALMKELSKKFEITMYAFCLMPNHIHFLLCPGQDNLHLFLKALFGRYATRFNKCYERRGHLFGGPFRQSVVLDDAYLLAASLYIHLNPIRAGLSGDPREYRFSSCRLYTSPAAPESFVDASPVLSLLMDDKEGSISKYTELLKKGTTIDSGNVLEDKGAIDRLLEFLKTSFPALIGKGKPRTAGSPPSDSLIDIPDFETLRGLRNSGSMKTKKYIVEQLQARGLTQTEIAERLGVSRKTIYNLLQHPGQ